MKNTSLFDGVSDEEYAAMMVCFKTVIKKYRKGEEIPMPHARLGIVENGHISLMKTDINGVRTIFEQLGAGGVFGDVLGFAWADGSFFLVAEEDSDVLYIDYEHIIKRCANACAHHSAVVSNLVKLMSEKTQALSEHLEILSRRTTREKLLAYFAMLAAKKQKPVFYYSLFADQPCGLYLRGQERHGAGASAHERRRAHRHRAQKRQTYPKRKTMRTVPLATNRKQTRLRQTLQRSKNADHR